MSTRVVLVSKESSEKELYLNALTKLGVDVDSVSSFGELRKIVLENPCHGILVDLRTKINAPKGDKEIAHDILEIFPVVQLRWDPEENEIKTLYFGQAKGGGTLEEFINEECQSIPPRAIRASIRRNIHFNVLLSGEEGFEEDTLERSITINVSGGGCFIFSSNDWEIGDHAWFTLGELDDSTVILGEVRWAVPWGETMQFPGIGVKFLNISGDQSEQLSEKFHI